MTHFLMSNSQPKDQRINTGISYIIEANGRSSAPVAAKDFLGGLDAEALALLRRTDHQGRRDGSPRFYCGFCKDPVHIRVMSVAESGTMGGRRASFVHDPRTSPRDCPFGTFADQTSPAQIDGARFQGRQEGARHKFLKTLLCDMLAADPTIATADCEVLVTGFAQDGTATWRRPDVLAVMTEGRTGAEREHRHAGYRLGRSDGDGRADDGCGGSAMGAGSGRRRGHAISPGCLRAVDGAAANGHSRQCVRDFGVGRAWRRRARRGQCRSGGRRRGQRARPCHPLWCGGRSVWPGRLCHRWRPRIPRGEWRCADAARDGLGLFVERGDRRVSGRPWPKARRHVVQIGRELAPKDVAGARIHVYPRAFGQVAMVGAPFPADLHYDAKAWELCVAMRGPGRVLFWNVALLPRP